jgi:hypothetical protein
MPEMPRITVEKGIAQNPYPAKVQHQLSIKLNTNGTK